MGLWHRLFPPRQHFSIDPQRWVVLDVEASGLDPGRDRLLSLAALGLHVVPSSRAPVIPISDSFEVVLRQPAEAPVPAVRANILIHGIGLGAQASGLAPEQALSALARYVARSPLIAFHSSFDKTLIDRHMRSTLGYQLANPWIDLEHVAAVLCKQARRLSLDDWMKRLDVRCDARHQAAADTLATTELLLKLWPLLKSRGLANWEGISRVAGEVDLLPGRY